MTESPPERGVPNNGRLHTSPPDRHTTDWDRVQQTSTVWRGGKGTQGVYSYTTNTANTTDTTDIYYLHLIYTNCHY